VTLEAQVRIARVLSCIAIASLSGVEVNAQSVPGAGPLDPLRGSVEGRPSAFLRQFLAFRAKQLASANPDLLTISLGFVKGLSRSFTGTSGSLSIDLRTGEFSARVSGLTSGESFTLALVDRDEAGKLDRTLVLAAIAATGPTASAVGKLDPGQVAGFALDRATLTRASTGEVLASGAMSVFQKVFFRRLGVAVTGAPALSFAEPTRAPVLASLVPDVSAETAGAAAQSVPIDVLIRQGGTLFTTGTFSGNGRTCATCHPASNNLTIDTAFIATLPANDPLFVAEFNPALAQLEKPQLMRGFGLILENLDGLGDPTNKFVMRGVPHTLGLPVSLLQDAAQPNPPAEMTGWSGDGAPGAGSLRDFATGAVTQHFTKSLARVPNQDFVLPSEHQLDALEGFQLSLGRDTDFDLSHLSFLDPDVDTGKFLFVNGTGNPLAGGRCSACHGNSGALAANGLNRNFNTNVEDVVHPARSVLPFPHDGGFGQTANPDGTFGNRTFNTASVVEAADTAPFFHDNVVSTLEGVIGFYTGPEFNGPRPPGARFSFDATQAAQLTDFIRGINTLQNVDVARSELAEILALNGNPQPQVQERLQTAFTETGDAIRVLNQGGIYPNAVTQIDQAQQLIVQAQQTANPNTRRTIIQQAITTLDGARGLVATVTP